MPRRIAHRGMPRRLRENSLAGFALALQLGADGIELDVHATLDGTVVVHHDPALADGTAIADTRWDELRRRESAPGVPVPTLAEVRTLVDGRATLYVEIKGPGIEGAVRDALHRYPGEAAIHSFDHALIARLHRAGCEWPLGILFDAGVADVPGVMERTGARDVWPHFSLVTPALVDAVHARGGQVVTWTVNDAMIAARLAGMGVDGLCGDDITVFSGAS
jgi:glycerophosphoryl diester phosphodiesterase